MNNEETLEKKEETLETLEKLVYEKPMLKELYVAPNVVSGLSNNTDVNDNSVVDPDYDDEFH